MIILYCWMTTYYEAWILFYFFLNWEILVHQKYLHLSRSCLKWNSKDLCRKLWLMQIPVECYKRFHHGKSLRCSTSQRRKVCTFYFSFPSISIQQLSEIAKTFSIAAIWSSLDGEKMYFQMAAAVEGHSGLGHIGTTFTVYFFFR